jgi:acyl carrier protein
MSDRRSEIEQIVINAVEGTFSLEDLRKFDGDLRRMKIRSIQYMKILDSLERSYGIVIDSTQDPVVFETVDGMVEFVRAQGV